MKGRPQIWLVLAFMVLVLGIASPGFWEPGNLINLVQQSGITAILGVGLTFVIISGGIDLSVGSVLALAGVVSATVAVSSGSTALAVVVGIGVGVAAGLVNGWITTFGRIPPFISTLGMMLVARSVAKVFTGSHPISGLPVPFLALASEPLGVPMVVWVAAACYLAAHVVLERTKLGRYTYAIGGNEQAAWISGVPIDRYKVYVYALCGGLAGLASVLLTARLNSASPLSGEMYELYAIAAAVIGGVSLSGGQGHVIGTLVGALIMALLRNGLNSLDVPSAWEGIVVGGVVVVAAIVDSAHQRTESPHPRKRLARRLALATAAGLILAGAVGVRTYRAKSESTTYTIGFVPKSINSPFWIMMKDAAEKEAKRSGARVITLAPERETDVEAQFQIVENFIEQKVDALLLAPCGAKEILPAIRKANQAGIPVLAIDSDVDRAAAKAMGVATATYIGSDNEEGGRMAARLMISALGGNGDVAIVQGTPGHESTDARQRGFEEVLAKEGTGMHVVAIQTANAERARAFSVTQNLLEAHASLRGIFGANDEMALGAVEAVDAARKLDKVTVVGFDAAPDALTSIRSGRLKGSVAQYPSEMGRLGVLNAIKIVHDHATLPATIHTKVEIITQANLPK